MQRDATSDSLLTTKQRRAVLALLAEPGIEAAAKAAGVKRETLWRWRREPAFREALAEARRDAFGAAVSRLAHTCASAAETLARNLECGAPTVEVNAAKAILEHARAAIELDHLSERLAAVEERLKEAP
ncbi:MAG: hypothetical protein HY321_15215 [Armatimonadetes bacterium]|nr:hypothetical protein [Armatimonadota bacterium]